MVNESNFIVRLSGRKADCWYIDYSGIYKVVEIAKITGVKASFIKEIYLNNDGAYDESTLQVIKVRQIIHRMATDKRH